MKNEPVPIPIACTLSEVALNGRINNELAPLFAQHQETKELDDGYAFRFANNDTIIEQLFHFIQTERQCCAFFKFTLTVEPNHGAVWLALSGGNGVKSFIASQIIETSSTLK